MRARLARLGKDLRAQRYGIVLAALALMFALGVPAYAVEGASSAANSLAKALKIAKQADKRSKQALNLAQRVGAKGGQQGAPGAQGPVGAQGPGGAQGLPGADGSPDTGPQILSKLAPFDGEASGLDSDQIDGLDSTAFHQGGGETTSDSAQVHSPDRTASAVAIVELSGFARVSSVCSAQATDSARLRLTNKAGVTMDAYVDDGGASATFAQVAPEVTLSTAVFTSPSPAADFITWQVRAGSRAGVLTGSTRYVSNPDGSVDCFSEAQITMT